MKFNSENHPCFNKDARHKFGRVHLPVAPRCNIQCRFCDRKFDCVNESRPGVSSGILSPYQALVYLDHVFEEKQNISVVGIAGPGDPFANPEETMETMRLVRQKYPEILLCVATNGLGILPYLDELKDLNVGHVTVTVNAVRPEIAEKVYAWVRYGKKALKAEEGAKILLEHQEKAIKGLKARGITVKINTILIPGVNDNHVVEVAERMAGLGVDIFNCLPYYPNQGSAFADIEEPKAEVVSEIRSKCGEYVKQMTHCRRCRADAVGCLGEKESETLMAKLKACEAMPDVPDSVNPEMNGYSNNNALYAVASMEGVLVNQHLGEADRLLIYRVENETVSLVEERETPAPGSGPLRWKMLYDDISDCSAVFVSGIGRKPKEYLLNKGMEIFEVEGLIEEAVRGVSEGAELNHMKIISMKGCGTDCQGSGLGCG